MKTTLTTFRLTPKLLERVQMKTAIIGTPPMGKFIVAALTAWVKGELDYDDLLELNKEKDV